MSPSSPAGRPPATVAVFRALQLGDLLCALPALRSLRSAWPDARLDLVGLPGAAAFCGRYPDIIDALVPFPGWPGLPEREPDTRAIPGFLREMQARRYDLAVQLHGDGTVTNGITRQFGAAQAAGFVPPGRAPGPLQVTYPDRGHEIGRLLAVSRALTGLPGDPATWFPVREDDRRTLAEAWPGWTTAGPYVCIHAGARSAARRWPPASFALVADRLAAMGLRPVITGGPGEEELAADVKAAMRAPSVDLAGRTSLGALAALLSRASLLVSNDTGVSHIAAALGTPSVVLFLASDPDRWAPLDAFVHRPVVLAGATDGPDEQAERVLAAARDLVTSRTVLASA